MFKQGMLVVHRKYGVGIIKGTEDRQIGDNPIETYLIIEIKDNGAPKKVFCTVRTAPERLRKVSEPGIIEKALKSLKTLDADYEARDTWNSRYRGYMEELDSGELSATCKVFKELMSFAARGEMSFGERKLLDLAKSLLCAEISASFAIDGLQAEAMIMEAMGYSKQIQWVKA